MNGLVDVLTVIAAQQCGRGLSHLTTGLSTPVCNQLINQEPRRFHNFCWFVRKRYFNLTVFSHNLCFRDAGSDFCHVTFIVLVT